MKARCYQEGFRVVHSDLLVLSSGRFVRLGKLKFKLLTLIAAP